MRFVSIAFILSLFHRYQENWLTFSSLHRNHRQIHNHSRRRNRRNHHNRRSRCIHHSHLRLHHTSFSSFSFCFSHNTEQASRTYRHIVPRRTERCKLANKKNYSISARECKYQISTKLKFSKKLLLTVINFGMIILALPPTTKRTKKVIAIIA